MHPLVATRRIRQESVHPLRIRPHMSQLLRLLALAVLVGLIDKHAATVGGVAIARATILLRVAAAQRALGEVQMHGQALKLVVVDLVEVVDGAHEICTDVALLVEGLEATPHAHVLVQRVLGLGVLLLVGVDPLLDVDGARAVVKAVRDVGGLGVHGAYLAYDGHLRDGVVIDGKVGTGIGLFEVEELLDGDRSEGLV